MMETMLDRRHPPSVSPQLDQTLTNCAPIMMLNDNVALARAMVALSAAVNADVEALGDAHLKRARASEIFECLSRKFNLLRSKSSVAADSA